MPLSKGACYYFCYIFQKNKKFILIKYPEIHLLVIVSTSCLFLKYFFACLKSENPLHYVDEFEMYILSERNILLYNETVFLFCAHVT